MSEPKIVINKLSGNLNQQAVGQDFISGMVFYTQAVPSGQTAGFTTVIGSVQEADTYNIKANSATTNIDIVYSYYQIKEYFRLNPNGKLYITYSNSTTYDFAEIKTLSDFSNGTIRQVSVFTYSRALNTSDITAIQTICDTLSGLYQPLSVFYAPNVKNLVLSGVTNLRSGTFSCPSVSVVIGGDGGVFATTNFTGFTASQAGAFLGALSSIAVNKSIAEVGKIQVNEGTTTLYDVFIGGTAYNSVSDTVRNQLYDYGYLYVKKFANKEGRFIVGETNANKYTDDYNKISRQRVFDKAKRIMYTQLLDFLNSTIQLNDDGTLAAINVKMIENSCKMGMDVMKRNTELSNYKVFIDPTQNVLSTSTLNVVLSILPTATAEYITVNIGYTLSL